MDFVFMLLDSPKNNLLRCDVLYLIVGSYCYESSSQL